MTGNGKVRVMTGAEVQAAWEAGGAVRLVDVREQGEWEASHIPQILLMPMSEFAARCRAELNLEEEIICICEHGVRSARAAEYLHGLGYTNVATMTGGMAVYPGPTQPGAGAATESGRL